MNDLKILLFVISITTLMAGCTPAHSQKASTVSTSSKEFKEYWYAGQAELTRYQLDQARYGEVHKGDAVLIFVTEDFNTKSQIKHEYGDRKNVTSVLKLNATRKFNTGIYPYSMMSSTFSPVDGKMPTLKVTTSSQEWCGHTYSQLNLKNKQYKGRLHSYFQDEGDQEFNLPAATLEDELWSKIRLDPQSLPTGNVQLIPGSMFLRLKHIDIKVENATATLSDVKDETLSMKPLKSYHLVYKDIERSLTITFEATFPYAIVSWEETGQSGYGPSAKMMTTRAIRTHSIKSAYWSENDLADAVLREQLGLDAGN